MNYRLYLVVLVLALVCYSAESKTKITLTDKEDGKTIPYAKFIVKKHLNSKDTVISQMTNKLGSATLDLNLPFQISVNQTGYDSLTKVLENEEDLKVELDRKVFYIDEIVTTGQYSPQSSQKSVYQIRAITEERIQAQNAPNLRELLMTEMNVRINQDQITGSQMSVNGLNGRGVKILIDGVPVVGKVNDNVDISQINLNNVRQIEVVEGPMSSLYGTDAIGGVINLITKDVIDGEFYINANSFYESVGTYNFDGQVGYNFNKNNVIISGGRNFFGGYPSSDKSRLQQWKPKEQYFGGWQFNSFFENLTFRYNGQYFNEYILNRGEPLPPYGENAYDEKYVTDKITNTLSLKGEIAKNRYIDVIGDYSFFNRQRTHIYKNLVTLKEVIADSSLQTSVKYDNWMLRANYSHDNLIKNVSYQAGIDLNYGYTFGDRIDKRRAAGDYALFASAQWSFIENLVLQPSVRFMYNTNYEAPVAPTINIKYDLDKDWSVRGSYAKGFRAPSLYELYVEFVDINHNILGNPLLKAENSDSYNFGLNFNNSSENYSLKIEQTFFYNNIKDLATLVKIDPDKNKFSYINIGESKTMGTNLSLKYVRADLTSNIGISYIGRQYLSLDFEGSPKTKFTPEAMANIIYSLPLWDLKLNTFYKYTGKLISFFAKSPTEYLQTEMSDYHTLDISLTRNFMDDMVTCSIGFKNLFDVTDIQRTGSSSGEAHSDSGDSSPVMWGRSFTASMRWNIR